MSPDWNNNREGHRNKYTRFNAMKVIIFNKRWYKWYCGVIVDNLGNLNLPAINYCIPTPIPNLDNAIINTGANLLYLYSDAPYPDNYLYYLPIILGNATGHTQTSTATFRNLPTHLTNHMRKGHIFLDFKKSLAGIGPFCDADCKVPFTKDTVAVFDPSGETILKRWW